jgi:toxin ParE1/3/4
MEKTRCGAFVGESKRPRVNKLTLDSCVEEELWEIWSFIARQNPSAATRVTKAAWRTFRKLAVNPGLGHPRTFREPRLKGILVHKVIGFPNFLIFYRHKKEHVQILHVYNGARDIDALFEES